MGRRTTCGVSMRSPPFTLLLALVPTPRAGAVSSRGAVQRPFAHTVEQHSKSVPSNWQVAPAGNPHRFAFVGDVGGQQISNPVHTLLHCALFGPLQTPPQQQVPPQQGFRESQQVSPQQAWSQQMPSCSRVLALTWGATDLAAAGVVAANLIAAAGVVATDSPIAGAAERLLEAAVVAGTALGGWGAKLVCRTG